ncbi:MAG: hypothetical protein V3V74_01355 [Nitrosomonadaceae bacterium]
MSLKIEIAPKTDLELAVQIAVAKCKNHPNACPKKVAENAAAIVKTIKQELNIRDEN